LMVLDGNQITGNAGIGLQSGDGSTLDKLMVVNNTISGNTGPAFTADYGSPGPFQGSNLLWQNNTVSGNGNNYQPPSKGSFFDNLPMVDIDAPIDTNIGAPVAFSLNYSGPQSIANVLWDLGDGLPETISNPLHIYSEAGTYRVGLVVWDALGRAAHDEIMLTVAVPEPAMVILFAIAGLCLLFVRRCK
ncbi:MAG TPA: PKD domain-containing protein, partial [Thermoguttaceae bacterium]